MSKVRFYRVESLPETGIVGGLYFVYKDESPKLYVYTADGFEQYSDLFDRDFSTLSVDALANAGDGVVYFTPDTHLIIKDGVVYGYEDLTGYATELWVEELNYLKEHQDISGKQDIIDDLLTIRDGAALGATALQSVPDDYVTEEELTAKGYLTEHQDISGKVDIADFEEATLVTSAALNTLNLNLADKESDILLLLAQVLELQNQISTLIGHYNELENIIG